MSRDGVRREAASQTELTLDEGTSSTPDGLTPFTVAVLVFWLLAFVGLFVFEAILILFP